MSIFEPESAESHAITCGNCGGQHNNVQEVRDCFEGVLPGTTVASPPATEAQRNFAQILYRQREPYGDLAGVEANDGHEAVESIIDSMDKRNISEFITTMKNQPYRPKTAAKVEDITEGMYRTPDGDVYKVQRAVSGSGRLYAKKLHVLPTFTEGSEEATGKIGKFEYQAGGLARLRPEYKMSLEDAKQFGQLYGVCCKCGRTLTDEESIAAGIGPICASKGWDL